ncbi:MAG: RraA family protein [Candidatus Bathyarchaeota archaeon]|nr:RraA family protein [Candidatus Bathyarchaeota archaeon]
MATFSSDEERFNLMRDRLYTAVVSDVLDNLGLRNQAMRHDIRPLHPDFVLVGRARTAFWIREYRVRENPYDNEIELIDSLRPGDVTVHSTDFSGQIAPWGELLSTASKMRGSTGAVVDAFTRDVKKIIEMGFPVFTRGIKPLDSRGRGYIQAYDVPIPCGDMTVRPNEIVFGDYDGVMVIPEEVEDEVLSQALEKVSGENNTRRELLEGKLLADVYERYGVL